MKIKQLVWVPSDSRYGGNVHKAETQFGPYTIFGDGTVWSPGHGLVKDGWINGDGDYKNDRLEEAKKWAQTDFEQRVANCFEELND